MTTPDDLTFDAGPVTGEVTIPGYFRDDLQSALAALDWIRVFNSCAQFDVAGAEARNAARYLRSIAEKCESVAARADAATRGERMPEPV